jgi:methionyl-tRNA formyltransferase
MVRAVFMGSDLFSLPVLVELATQGPLLPESVHVVAVVTQPDRPAGRGRKLQQGPVKQYALEREILVLQPERLKDANALDAFRATMPDLVVVASYGQILPRTVLDEPTRGCLNLHPSLLPRYRGPSPIAAPILAGDPSTGVTLMLMSSKMDAGPIVAQEETPIDDAETTGELERRLADMSAHLLLRVLPEWLDDRCRPRAQDEAAATYTRRLSKDDARIDWSLSAVELSRAVRAYNPWPIAFTSWEDTTLRVLRARPAEGEGTPGQVIGRSESGIIVATGDGGLAISEIQLPGGRPLPVSEALRGHPELLNARFGGRTEW